MALTPLWASVADLPDDLVDHPQVGVQRATEALEFASYVLWSLSGRSYSPANVTTEAYDTRQALSAGTRVYPVFMGGRPYNTTACSKCACSGCGVFHRTRLRGYPVRTVIDVWVDGCLLSPHDYVLLDNSVLGLMNGAVCGAQCLVVKYVWGSGVPPGGKNAAAKLAQELLESARGGDCSLPERVTSVSRQGMSWTLLDPQDFLSEGRTGVYEIDLMLASLNPAKALARPRVFSPDLPRATAYQYAEPPLSLVLEPGDQVVQRGLPARWASNDLGMIEAARAAADDLSKKGKTPTAALTTILGDNFALAGAWHELTTYSGGVVLDLTADEVGRVWDGMGYRVEDAQGKIVIDGLVRVLGGS